jgi:choline transport protein
MSIHPFNRNKLTKVTRNHKWNIPFNSVYATSAIVAILSLIPLGSSLAFEILVSLSLQGLLSTYMISIGQFHQMRFRS